MPNPQALLDYLRRLEEGGVSPAGTLLENLGADVAQPQQIAGSIDDRPRIGPGVSRNPIRPTERLESDVPLTPWERNRQDKLVEKAFADQAAEKDAESFSELVRLPGQIGSVPLDIVGALASDPDTEQLYLKPEERRDLSTGQKFTKTIARQLFGHEAGNVADREEFGFGRGLGEGIADQGLQLGADPSTYTFNLPGVGAAMLPSALEGVGQSFGQLKRLYESGGLLTGEGGQGLAELLGSGVQAGLMAHGAKGDVGRVWGEDAPRFDPQDLTKKAFDTGIISQSYFSPTESVWDRPDIGSITAERERRSGLLDDEIPVDSSFYTDPDPEASKISSQKRFKDFTDDELVALDRFSDGLVTNREGGYVADALSKLRSRFSSDIDWGEPDTFKYKMLSKIASKLEGIQANNPILNKVLAYGYEAVKEMDPSIRDPLLKQVARISGSKDFIPDKSTAPGSSDMADIYLKGVSGWDDYQKQAQGLYDAKRQQSQQPFGTAPDSALDQTFKPAPLYDTDLIAPKKTPVEESIDLLSPEQQNQLANLFKVDEVPEQPSSLEQFGHNDKLSEEVGDLQPVEPIESVSADELVDPYGNEEARIQAAQRLLSQIEETEKGPLESRMHRSDVGENEFTQAVLHDAHLNPAVIKASSNIQKLLPSLKDAALRGEIPQDVFDRIQMDLGVFVPTRRDSMVLGKTEHLGGKDFAKSIGERTAQNPMAVAARALNTWDDKSGVSLADHFTDIFLENIVHENVGHAGKKAYHGPKGSPEQTVFEREMATATAKTGELRQQLKAVLSGTKDAFTDQDVMDLAKQYDKKVTLTDAEGRVTGKMSMEDMLLGETDRRLAAQSIRDELFGKTNQEETEIPTYKTGEKSSVLDPKVQGIAEQIGLGRAETQKWPITRIPDSEYAKADADSNYTPREEIVAYIEAPSEKHVERKLAQLVKQGVLKGTDSYLEPGSQPFIDVKAKEPGQLEAGADKDYDFAKRVLTNPDEIGAAGKILSREEALAKIAEIEGITPEEAAKKYAPATADPSSLGSKAKNAFSETAATMRAVMSSFDFSAPLRQGLILSASHPLMAAKAFKDQFKMFASEAAFDALEKGIQESPNRQLYEDSGLQFSTPATEKSGRLAAEEPFQSRFAEKYIPGIRQSERAYTGFLNKMRQDVFDHVSKQFMESGLDPHKNLNEFKSLAGFINNATGRGDLGGLEKHAQLLTDILFSPRLIASRLRLMNPVEYVKMAPQARKYAMKSMAKTAAAVMTIAGMASAAGADVETDPRSSDFMKMRVGNTRYDLTGGFQPYVRLFAQLAGSPVRAAEQIKEGKFPTGQEKVGGKVRDLKPGKYSSNSRLQKVASFGEAKLSPMASLMIDALRGTNFEGDATGPKDILDRFTPMIAQDFADLWKEEGVKAFPMITPGVFGAGVQTYRPKAKKKKKSTSILQAL